MNSRRMFCLSLIFISGCQGATGPERTQHYTVQSTPTICGSFPPNPPEIHFCANTAATNTHSIEVEGDECFGFKPPQWGVTYKITLKEQSQQVFDGCTVKRTLASIDSEIPDPIGTRYMDNVGSSFGGLTISRTSTGAPWYQLSGYSRPIFCDNTLCGSAEVGVKLHIMEATQMPYVFELIELDGVREIAIKPM